MGFRPFDFERYTLHPGDLLIVPHNAAETTFLPPEAASSTDTLTISLRLPLITESWRVAAGFYGSYFGPLPFVASAVPSEEYEIDRLGMTMYPKQWGLTEAASGNRKAK
jgi:hypothetical protein